MMCRLLMFTLMVGMFILTCPSLSAADPDPVIVYQGRITQAGAPVTGTHTLSFVLIDVGNGGATLWSSGNLSLSVTEGLYSVVLGGGGQPAIPTSVLDKASLAVSVTYDGTVLTPDAALKPALQARYAFAAGNAATADSATALSGINDVTHGGTGSATAAGARTNLGLGTVATLNAPASGDAAAAEVVKGNDTRLSDARTPTDLSVTTGKLVDGSVTTAKIDPAVLTPLATKAGVAADLADYTTTATTSDLDTRLTAVETSKLDASRYQTLASFPASPVVGDLVRNTTTGGIWYYTGVAWQRLDREFYSMSYSGGGAGNVMFDLSNFSGSGRALCSSNQATGTVTIKVPLPTASPSSEIQVTVANNSADVNIVLQAQSGQTVISWLSDGISESPLGGSIALPASRKSFTLIFQNTWIAIDR